METLIFSPYRREYIAELLKCHSEESFIRTLRFISSYTSSKQRIPPELIYPIVAHWAVGHDINAINRDFASSLNFYLPVSQHRQTYLTHDNIRSLVSTFNDAFLLLQSSNETEPLSAQLSQKQLTLAKRMHAYSQIGELINNPDKQLSELMQRAPHFSRLLKALSLGYNPSDYLQEYAPTLDTQQDDPHLIPNFNKRLLGYLYGDADQTANGHHIALAALYRKFLTTGTNWYNEYGAGTSIAKGLWTLDRAKQRGKLSESEVGKSSYLNDLFESLSILGVYEGALAPADMGYPANPYTTSWQEILQQSIDHGGILPFTFIEIIKLKSQFGEYNELIAKISKASRLKPQTVGTHLTALSRYIENVLLYNNGNTITPSNPKSKVSKFVEFMKSSPKSACTEILVILRNHISPPREA